MLTWFVKRAPIRVKFAILTVVYTCVAVAGALTTYLAAITPPGKATIYVWIEGAIALLTVVVALSSRKAICDPLVTTVVRMEGLAAGDLTSEIRYTDHTDCTGRMTKAMSVFRQNAERVRDAGEATSHVVGQLGGGLSRLAASDLSVRLEEEFPAEYETLRRDFNHAIVALAQVISVVSQATGGINTGPPKSGRDPTTCPSAPSNRRLRWRKRPRRWTRSRTPCA